jgi:hypothetical protein
VSANPALLGGGYALPKCTRSHSGQVQSQRVRFFQLGRLKCCTRVEHHTANYRGCSKWKEAKAAAARRAQIQRGRRDGVSTRLHAPKSAPSMPTEQEALGSGWNHVVQGGRIVKAHATSSPTPTTSDLDRRSERQAVHTDGPCKSAGLEAPVVKSLPHRSKHADSTPTRNSQSPLGGIADLDNLPTKACIELTRRLLSTAAALPTGDDRSRAILKTVILFIAEYTCAA